MRGLPAVVGFLAATVGATSALLGKWIPKPQQSGSVGLFGVLRAIVYCPNCRGPQTHTIHDSVHRTCNNCGHGI